MSYSVVIVDDEPPARAKLMRFVEELADFRVVAQAGTVEEGIMAVKKGTSRQRLMQQALGEFFGRMARDYANECACLSAGCEPDGAPPRGQGS